ncbi:SusE domain-containing protein [Fulvivirga ligni]|uniref:SusE domain-containing protein n=1 Tax=Fulvivirga ligni TaxID=2904246 RepID=UPI001F215C5F|nr:SusE domain-containing protein [Fulvivirga ligni]UII19980.1 SusE domain-containing protein [Fulvivirga ligni]
MKNIYKSILLLLAVTLAVSCDDENTFSIGDVNPVTDLYSPSDNAFYDLEANSSVVFEWAAAATTDNGVVLYEVYFDVESGDLSDPIYKTASDGNGYSRSLTLTFSELNKIAGLANIGRGASGKLKWSVVATRGVDETSVQTSRLIEVQRPSGFPVPGEVFLAGTATETGDDMANARAFKKTGESTFEIYTTLSSGEYFVADGKDGEAQTYSIVEGKMKEGGTTTSAYSGETVRLILDFSNGNVQMDVVNKVELYFSPSDEYLFELPYVGNGTWKAENQSIEFQQESWGRDERYKFRFTFNTDEFNWYGSANSDNSRPDNAGDEFWYMYPVNDSRWDYAFKFASAVDNSVSDVSVMFNASVPEYTHVVTPK